MENMEEENSLIKKLLILWGGRKIILIFTFIFAVLSLIYAFYLPPVYKAECYFLPPNQDMTQLNVFVRRFGQSERVGGLTDLTGLPETVTSGQMLLGVMKRNSIVDAVIDKFSLMEVYKQDFRVKMRDMLVKKLTETGEDPKSGIISVGILHEDPKRAAEIANFFVELLQSKMLDIAVNEAAQRRAFFEKQLFEAWQYLNDVQNELLNYQEQLGGVAIPQSQMEATLKSITEIRQQIADKKVEISSLSTYAPPTNPRLRAAHSQLEALTKELERLEDVQKNSSPQLSIEYQRHEMRVRYAANRYETVLQQLENAKIDEAQGFFQLQIVDYATPPDFKYKPSKARIIILGTFAGFLLSCFYVVFSNFFSDIIKSAKKFLHDNPDFNDEEDDEGENEDDESGFRFSVLKRHISALAPALLFMTAILLLTFQPSEASGEMSAKFQQIIKTLLGLKNTPAWLLDMKMLRAFAHVFLYFPLGAAVYYALKKYGASWGKAVFSALIISSSFGLADEAVKMFLPGREFDFADWTLDILGNVLGIFSALLCNLFFHLFMLKFKPTYHEKFR